MRYFIIKSNPGILSYLEIIADRGDVLDIHITTIRDDVGRETWETMTKDLFEACVRTGYLTPAAELAAQLSA
jgi:hypothetical protein